MSAAGRGRTHGFAAVLVAVIATVAGCSKPAKTLDDGATQRVVAGAVADRLAAPVRGATCPDGITRGQGRTFTCAVDLAATDGTVRVRVRQADDGGRLDVALLDAVVSEKRVTAELKQQLRASFARSFQADCGDGYRIVAPGGTFRCQASDANGRKAVLITVTDTAGTLRFKVLP